MRPALLAVVLLAGCSGPGGAAASEPPPEGRWRGSLVAQATGRVVPATLDVGASGAVELVAGAARVRADDVAYEHGRLRFRAPQFPVTPTRHRALRCDLYDDGVSALGGTCRAGTATYRLSLRRSASL